MIIDRFALWALVFMVWAKVARLSIDRWRLLRKRCPHAAWRYVALCFFGFHPWVRALSGSDTLPQTCCLRCGTVK